MLSFLPELTRRAGGALVVAALAAALLAPQAKAAAMSGQGTWETTLKGRDLDGNAATFEAYYDTALNITWLADANFAKTSNYDADGYMTWATAKAWADNLVVGAYSDWRLPTMLDTGTPGCNFSFTGGTDCGYNVQTKDASTGTVYSEMAHLFYVSLGDKGQVAPTGSSGFGLSNTGPFSNVQSYIYWSGVAYAPNTGSAWYFATNTGRQDSASKFGELFVAWAVSSGDIGVAAVAPAAAVPEPQSYALALAGLAVAAALARKRRA
jgi:hypothetical protein